MKTAGKQVRLNKRIIKAIILILVVAAAFILIYRVMRWFETSNDEIIDEETSAGSAEETADDPLETEDGRQTIWYNDKYYALRDDLRTFLIIGVDKFENAAETDDVFRNEEQSDFLLLVVIDPTNQSCKQIQINRDTMTDIRRLSVSGQSTGYRKAQIALSHTYGTGKEDSCENTAAAVSTLLYGMKIDHYMSVTMDAVTVLNDLAGGVPVKIEDDFSGTDKTLIQGETITLMGDQALHYIRSRGSMEDSTNIARMGRQRVYMKSFYHQVRQRIDEDPMFVVYALLSISDYMVSDCTVDELAELSDAIYYAGPSPEILSLKGEAKVGEQFMEFYPDENALKELVINTFYEEVE